ncbi:MAG TPA: hypothetical protein VMC85_13995 [Desulfomonilaceae bacterium]|nr:hypothetical protein [Desulfomonilaceae bacterium]
MPDTPAIPGRAQHELPTATEDHEEQSMMDTNTNAADDSLVTKGREFLEQGDISSAVECYGQAFDPDSADEAEARSMLIEGRSHLSRKHLLEALECFEEALLMGTEVQRRQALEEIMTIGEIRAKVGSLISEVKKGLKERFGKRSPASSGLALLSDVENIVVIEREAFERLPSHLAKGSRITRIPQHITEERLPFATDKCVPFTEKDDVRFILEIASSLSEHSHLHGKN